MIQFNFTHTSAFLHDQKLTDAALQQVQLMQSLGTMPAQQANHNGHNYNSLSYPTGSPTNGHNPHQHPPPPYPMYGYPYHQPPPPGQGMGSTGGSSSGQPEGGMPPPHAHHPPPHWHPYPPPHPHAHHPHHPMPPPPHPYYHHHYGATSRPPAFMPQGSGRAADDSKKKDDASHWGQEDIRNHASARDEV